MDKHALEKAIKERRYAQMQITSEAIIDLITRNGVVQISRSVDLPVDAQCLSIDFDLRYKSLFATFVHTSFDVVIKGNMLPTLEATTIETVAIFNEEEDQING